MLSIRLTRVGTKKRPVYRIVVMPKHRDPWAKATEILGHYNPRKQPRELVVKADRVKYWLSQGAEATNTVWNLLVDEKIVEGDKRGVSHITKKRKGKLAEKAEAQAQKEAEAKAKAEEEKAAAEEAAKAEAEAKAAEEAAAKEAAEAPAEEKTEEAPAEEAAEETPAEEPAKEEAPAEEKAEEAPAEEAATE